MYFTGIFQFYEGNLIDIIIHKQQSHISKRKSIISLKITAEHSVLSLKPCVQFFPLTWFGV
jgi:hypothetical protein